MRHLFNRSRRSWLELALLAVSITCRGSATLDLFRAASLGRRVEAAIHTGTDATAIARTIRPGEPVGVLDVSRLGVSVPITEGDEPETLTLSAGHLPDTPFPWDAGNSAIAGHRDTHFRRLGELVLGDVLRLRTSRGVFLYRVNATLIVMPDDLSVLAPSPERTLTLITCYPFRYFGRAAKRFVVRARAVLS